MTRTPATKRTGIRAVFSERPARDYFHNDGGIGEATGGVHTQTGNIIHIVHHVHHLAAYRARARDPTEKLRKKKYCEMVDMVDVPEYAAGFVEY